MLLVDTGGWNTDFKSRSDSIRLGSGWHSSDQLPEPIREPGWSSTRAWFYAPDLPNRDAKLILDLTVVDHPDKHPQQLVVSLNGEPLENRTLVNRTQTIEVPIADHQLRPGLNRFQLHFDRSPTLVDLGYSEIAWAVPARFDSIRIIPASATVDRHPVGSSRHQDQWTILLPSGSSIHLPLPIGAGARAYFDGLESANGGDLMLSILHPEGRSELLWEGAWHQINGQVVEIPAASAVARQLVIEHREPPEAAQSVDELPALHLTAGFVRFEYSPVKRGALTPEKPHVFIYVMDTLRADALGTYGSKRPTSPSIDRFAADSIVFEKAWASSAWTLPSLYSILTGVYPNRHGYVWGSVKKRPEFDIARLPEVLEPLGYRSVGISQTFLASEVYGVQTGFDQFYVDDWLGSLQESSRRVPWYFWRALLHHGDLATPIFAYIHTVDPHAPYNPTGLDRRFADDNPGGLREGAYRNPHQFNHPPRGTDAKDVTHLRALYDGGVSQADRQFGRFVEMLRFLNLYDDSLIILTSDHGEEFNEHGGFDHARTLFEELLRVPMIVKLPRQARGGSRLAEWVSIVDIAPTVFEIAGGSTSDVGRFDGISILDHLEDPDRYRGRTIHAHTSPEGQDDLYAEVALTAAIRGDLKCIQSSNGVDRFFADIPELRTFDLATDSSELRPLPSSDPRFRSCVKELMPWTATTLRSQMTKPTDQKLSAEELERLKALGYLE
jgi:arylsulfatase A-like enzyme